MLNRLARTVASARPAARAIMPARMISQVAAPAAQAAPALCGGHAAPAHHAHAPNPAMDKPWIFGEDPSVPRVREDWETNFYVGTALFFVSAYVVATHGPDTTMTKWAREEALHTGFKAPDVAPDLED